jgi:hypothetical protein
VMERIRIVIQILSEAKNLGWSASVWSSVLPLSTFRERMLTISCFLKICFQFYCYTDGTSKSTERFQSFSPDHDAKILPPSNFPFGWIRQKWELERSQDFKPTPVSGQRLSFLLRNLGKWSITVWQTKLATRKAKWPSCRERQ